MEDLTDKLLDGKAASQTVKDGLKPRIEALADAGKTPGLAVVLVGDDPGSKIYVNNKHKACLELGLNSYQHFLPEDTPEEEVGALLRSLNQDDSVDGILLQLPVPVHINPEHMLALIDPAKDVDGLHPQNLGNLMRGNLDACFTSCTPTGIIYLLKEYGGVDIKGKEVVIVNRSIIVGKPLIPLFLLENATVTTCHTSTVDLKFHTRRADIVVTGTGKPKMFDTDYFSPGVIIVDVGMDRDENNKLCGDVDFNTVAPMASKITPVPGGVGPMTIAMLLSNTVKAGELNLQKQAQA
jgi:methylenetetrahydrofolate dehydrogenase (NADP+)/methenyltetrahydrofolate cyclohydrolase